MTTRPKSRPSHEIHPDAVAVSAFRALPNGAARGYSISAAPSGRQAIVALVMQAQAVGYIKRAEPVANGLPYASLDLLDANDDIVQSWAVPTDRAFRWWKRKLHLRVESTDTPPVPTEEN